MEPDAVWGALPSLLERKNGEESSWVLVQGRVRWVFNCILDSLHHFLLLQNECNSPIDVFRSQPGFFDFYIIPLTQKLKECDVFGVSSDELLNYAQKNRAEWEDKGEEVVEEMHAECQQKYGVIGNIKIRQCLMPLTSLAPVKGPKAQTRKTEFEV